MPFPVRPRQMTRLGRFGRLVIKRYIYANFSLLTGLKIALGKDNPLMRFTIEDDPPSVYWVFRIKPEAVDDLQKFIRLSPRWTISPIRVLADDDPELVVVVNAYRVSGLTNALRAEWSVFIADSDGVPRYRVIDARSSRPSMDPMTVITRSSPVIHERHGDTITTRIGDGVDAFTSTITDVDAAPVEVSPEWVGANDYIYWGNDVRDRTFYDASLAQADGVAIAAENCSAVDATVWGRFVEPTPIYTMVVRNRIELVVSPWENVDQAPAS